MPGLVPGIHDFLGNGIKDVDGVRNSGLHELRVIMWSKSGIPDLD
jgi:hypothetical protein